MPDSDMNPSRRGLAFAVMGLAALAAAAYAWRSIKPRNDRNWFPEQERLATTSIDGAMATIRNVRNFNWRADGEPAPVWETRSYDLSRIESVWYLLSPFSHRFRGPAHAFLSFGFDDGSYVAISVEARKEAGETYSMLKGMLKRFELMYLIGDERDFIGLRTLRFEDEVYLYPVRATPEAARQLFTDMLEASNELATEPSFYGTIRNNCTTRVLMHANAVAPDPISWGLRVLLPGYSDALALEAGLLATDLPLEAARERFRIDPVARDMAGQPEFSRLIRERIQPLR